MENSEPTKINSVQEKDLTDEERTSVNPVVTKAPPSAHLTTQQKQSERFHRYIKLSVLIVVVFAIVIITLTYIIAPTMVDGTSMQPTFQTGNIVLVWKFPQTWADLTNSQYIPSRCNIVIINRTPILGEELIKRVIGLPGETMDISNGNVTINNSTYPNGFDPDQVCFGKSRPTIGSVDTQIGPGRIFVMGDNRGLGGSIDSRSSLGTIPSSSIQGRVIMRIYPLNKITLF